MDLGQWIVNDLRTLASRLEGGVLGLIPPERLRERADNGGIASIYVLWHLARHHDVAINGVIRNTAAVVENWTDRLGIGTDLWRGLAEAEDTDLVDILDPEAVGGYTLNVITSTANWLESNGIPDLVATPDTTAALQAINTPEDRFGWLYKMWEGQTTAWFLQWSAVGHGMNHLGELISIRNRLGLSPF